MKYELPFLTREFYMAAMPILVVVLGSLITMLQGVSKRFGGATAVFGITTLTLVGAFATLCGQNAAQGRFIEGTLLSTNLATWGMAVLLGIALVLVLMIHSSLWKKSFLRGEITSVFLMLLSGMMVVVSSDDLVTMFVGLEMSSIGIYVLAGYTVPTRRSQEGAIKYFVLGSFAAAFLLFGFALLYGATGSMKLSEIAPRLVTMKSNSWIQLGALFSIVGLGFKFALAPFHLWAPDVYEGAPTPVTAFMATSVKALVLVFILRIFATGGANGVYSVWAGGMLFMAILSMIVANIMALVQTSLKRMLAYSSIAHSGYMAVALAAIAGVGNALPVSAVMFYVVTYSIVSLGAFGVLMWLESEHNDNLQLDDLAGLAKKHPYASIALTVFMLSFSGMPPTVGFISKFFVFTSALQAKLYGLVIIGAIGSSISLFYYLRVIVRMFMSDPVPGSVHGPKGPSPVIALIAISVVLITILLGTVLPGQFLEVMHWGAKGLAIAH